MEAFTSVMRNKLSKVEKLRRSAEQCGQEGDFRGYCQLRAIAAESEARVYREAVARIDAAPDFRGVINGQEVIGDFKTLADR